MSFRRNYKEKLRLIKRAGLEPSEVSLLRKVSRKNKGKII